MASPSRAMQCIANGKPSRRKSFYNSCCADMRCEFAQDNENGEVHVPYCEWFRSWRPSPLQKTNNSSMSHTQNALDWVKRFIAIRSEMAHVPFYLFKKLSQSRIPIIIIIIIYRRETTWFVQPTRDNICICHFGNYSQSHSLCVFLKQSRAE